MCGGFLYILIHWKGNKSKNIKALQPPEIWPIVKNIHIREKHTVVYAMSFNALCGIIPYMDISHMNCVNTAPSPTSTTSVLEMYKVTLD